MASSRPTNRLLQTGINLAKSASSETPTSPVSNNTTQQLVNTNSEDSIVFSHDTDRSTRQKQQNKQTETQRPNAFISLRITNEQIIDRARQIQEEIIQHTPLLSKASVSIPTLHITLMVCALNTDDDKQRAQQSLIDACRQITLADIPSLEVSFSGLSHFKNKVLYIDPVKDAHYGTLARIAEICRDAYAKNGIVSTDSNAFQPHLTLFKLSKAPDLYRKGVRKIDPSWTTTYAGHHFGVQTVQSLHLCNMMKKQTDGYYEIFHEQSLVSPASISSSVNERQAIDTSEQAVDGLTRKDP